ncbi:uncharacterized protein LOC144711608 isoform X2 [Wolffia australiana]
MMATMKKCMNWTILHQVFFQDLFGKKTKKGFAIMMGLVAIASATLLGMYIWFIYLKQMSRYSIYVMNNKSIPEHGMSVDQCAVSITQPENGRLHYPRPTTFDRAECACNPVRFFAILSMQRSGSGWFETLLNSHPNISSNGEIFSVKQRRSNASSVLQTLDKIYNLDWASSASKNECSAAVGLKWMFNQGVLKYHEEIVDYFKRRGVSGIFLLRRNLLSRMVSIAANAYDQTAKPLNGTHKSHVHSKAEAEVLATYKPRINVSSLIPDLKRAEEMAAEAINYFNPTRHIILYYEDVVNNHTKLMEVMDFLEVPTRNLFSRQVRIHTRPLWEQVENWEQVRDTLNGTKYAEFLGHYPSL